MYTKIFGNLTVTVSTCRVGGYDTRISPTGMGHECCQRRRGWTALGLWNGLHFAEQCSIEPTPDHYFFTQDRIRQLEQGRLRGRVMLDHDDAIEQRGLDALGGVAYGVPNLKRWGSAVAAE